MAFKLIFVLALVACANAGLLPAAQVYHAAPAAQVYHAAPTAHVYHAAPAAQVYHSAPAAQVYHSAPGTQVYHAAPTAHVYHAAPANHEHHVSPTAVVKTVSPVTHYASHPIVAKADDEFDPHPQYKYGYNVQDAVSGDSKSQVEERDGDVVRGEYSLIDADGYKRTVKYTADDHNGFNAVVEREPLVKTEHAHTLLKTVAVPSVVKSVAPVTHYSNPAYTTFSSPAHYAVNH